MFMNTIVATLATTPLLSSAAPLTTNDIVARQASRTCGFVDTVPVPTSNTPIAIAQCLCTDILDQINPSSLPQIPGLPPTTFVTLLRQRIPNSPRCQPDTAADSASGLTSLLTSLLDTVTGLLGGLLGGLTGGGSGGGNSPLPPLPVPIPNLPVPGLPTIPLPAPALPALPVPVPALPALPIPAMPALPALPALPIAGLRLPGLPIV